MGSNDPEVDRLDRAAAQGLDRLTSGEGWFVPMGADLDYANATQRDTMWAAFDRFLLGPGP